MAALGAQWFHTLVIVHIASGTIGLLTMWVPIVGRKGSRLHKLWGKVFAYALMVTGAVAIGISLCTLAAPLETHPQFDDAALIRGLFGWMMLYLASVLNTRFIFQTAPPAQEWLVQHTRGLVGAGISVYTAFLAFGAVNLLPAYALNPALWATPTIIGVTYLLYHQARIMRMRQRLAPAR